MLKFEIQDQYLDRFRLEKLPNTNRNSGDY
jgi:hypothetical protein